MLGRIFGKGKWFNSFLVGACIVPVVAASAQSDFPIGYSSLGGTYGFIPLIEEQKLLEQEGIRPTFVYIGGPQISQALIAGDIRMAIVAGASPVRAAAHGADVRFIGGVTDKENIHGDRRSNITKPAELKGTRMAIDDFGDYTDFRARKVLERSVLKRKKMWFSCRSAGRRAVLRRFERVKFNQPSWRRH